MRRQDAGRCNSALEALAAALIEDPPHPGTYLGTSTIGRDVSLLGCQTWESINDHDLGRRALA